MSTASEKAKSEESHQATDEGHNIVSQFATYDEYLTSQITPLDLSYLEDEDIARQLVELGYRGAGDIMKREDFDAKKRTMRLKRANNRIRKFKSSGQGGRTCSDPFLQMLAEREEANRSGKISTIIFIRDKNQNNQEVSGYIDYSHRLRVEDFEQYFSKQQKLLPKQTDLSFYNWETHVVYSNDTSCFSVVTKDVTTLYFRHVLDKLLIDVDPKALYPGDSTIRTMVQSPNYVQVSLFDHIIRRRL